MVSELTELPHIEESSEQQKQEAMLRKMQKMKNANVIRRQKKSAEKFLKQQSKRNENHCRNLRNILADVRLRNIRKYDLDTYYFPAVHYYSGRAYNSGGYGYYTRYPYDFLEKDLDWEIREYCR
jgi:ATP phosphoribosyltransferase regulatory subunit HisZ